MLIIFTITAHGQNKLLSSLDQEYDGTNWLTYAGTNYEYDSNNNLIAETYSNYDYTNSKWEISYKDNYTYDVSNKVTEDINQDWNTLTNKFVNSYKDNYTYTNGKLTEIITKKWENSQWINDSRNTFTYNSNNLIETAIYYTWNGLQWVVDSRDQLTYNSINKIVKDLTEQWINNSEWVNLYTALLTYNVNNKIITTKSDEWDTSNSVWVESERIEYEFDANGNRTRETSFSNYGFKQEYTYDTSSQMSSFAHPFKDQTGLDYIFEDFPYVNKVMGFNRYSYDTATSSYTLSSRTTYNYNSSINLSTKQPEIANDKITLFPNPAKNFLTIQNESNTVIDKVIVTDISGKTVMQQNQNTTQVNVQNLAKGMYLLQAISGDKKQQTKFLKE